VRCLLIDFSRAFDTVDHSILMSKLTTFDIPQSEVNWVCSFLTGRSQVCKVNGILSQSRKINRSIVEGSGIGPTLYVVVESDLKPL
jgi:ribonucleases P/MRP protein subunit RPP40